MAPQTSASSPTPTAQLSRVSHAQSSESGRLIIVAIVLGCLIFVVLLVLAIVPLVRRRFYKRVPNTKTMADMNESKKVPQQYRKGHKPTQSEIVGMMPLLPNPPNRLSVVMEERPIYMSTASRERQMSAFISVNYEGVVAEFDPYALSRPSSREPLNLLPTAPQLIAPTSTFRALSPPPRLPPLIIPGLNDSPTPKPTRKASTRSVAESDDSASIYSQASASTYTAYRSNALPFSVSSIPPVPALPDYLKLAPRPLTLTHLPLLPSTSSTSFTDIHLSTPDDETTLTRGDTLFVGRLLKSRARDAPSPPSRSSTQVSRIERAGSIKPAISEEEEQYGSRYRVKNRVGRRKMRIQENIGLKTPMGTLAEASSPDLTEPPASPPHAFDRDGPLVDGQTPYPSLEDPPFYRETAPLNIVGAKEKAIASSE